MRHWEIGLRVRGLPAAAAAAAAAADSAAAAVAASAGSAAGTRAPHNLGSRN